MKKLLLLILSAGLFAGISALAGATKLVKSTPEDGSTSDSPPSAFVLEFTDWVTLRDVYLKKDNDKEKLLHVKMQPDTKTITIPAPSLAAGHYLLEWSVFTHQSSALSGHIRFTVSGTSSTAPP
ncbi:MAG TPA: copper resistance protein CopC [Chloroflexota bacterium]|nr:copper resistance protein CopC [Chloroflexota bacterium]